MRLAKEHDVDPIGGSLTRIATEEYVDTHSGPEYSGKSPSDLGDVLVDLDLRTLATAAGSVPTIAEIQALNAGSKALAAFGSDSAPQAQNDATGKCLQYNYGPATKMATVNPLGSTAVTVLGVMAVSNNSVVIESELAGASGYHGFTGAGGFYVNKGGGDNNFNINDGAWTDPSNLRARLVGYRVDATTLAKASIGRGGNVGSNLTVTNGAIVDKRLLIGGRSNGSSTSGLRLWRLVVIGRYLSDSDYADLQDYLADQHRT